MPFRKTCSLVTLFLFFTTTLLWTAPPAAWAGLAGKPLGLITGFPGASRASSTATAQAGAFISLVHNSISEGSTWNVTFTANDGSGQSLTFACSDTFDGYLRIQVPFFPEASTGLDSEDTQVTVTVEGLSGSPQLLVQAPEQFQGDYQGQALALMMEQARDSYQEQANSLRAKAAAGYAPDDLNAAAEHMDQQAAILQEKLDAITTYGLLPVTEKGGNQYSLTPYGLSLVDNMAAAWLKGLAEEVDARITLARTGSWPTRVSGSGSNTGADAVRRCNQIADYFKHPEKYFSKWARLGGAVFGGIATISAAIVGGSLAPYVAATYALYLAWATGFVDMAYSLVSWGAERASTWDVVKSVLNTGLNAISTMAGAAESSFQWLISLYNNGSTIKTGYDAYQEATGGGGGGGSELTSDNIVGTWSFDGWYKVFENGTYTCYAGAGSVTFYSGGSADWGQSVEGQWVTGRTTWSLSNGNLSIGDYGSGPVSGNTSRFTVYFSDYCHSNQWVFHR